MHNLNDGLLREDMRIVNGNVGIGTSDPLSDLDIYNPVGTELIVSRNAGSSVNPTIRLWNFDDNNYNNHAVGTSVGTINFSGNERLTGDTHTDNSRAFSYANTLYDWARISALFVGSSDSATTSQGYVRGDLAFYTNGGDGATSDLQERMRIKHNGNVGINSSSPSQKLDVDGYVKFGNALIKTAGPFGSGSGGVYTGINLNGGTGGGIVLLFVSVNSSGGNASGAWIFAIRKHYGGAGAHYPWPSYSTLFANASSTSTPTIYSDSGGILKYTFGTNRNTKWSAYEM